MPYLQIDTVDTQKTHKLVELGVGRFEVVVGAQRRELLWEVETEWYGGGSMAGKRQMKIDPAKTKNPLGLGAVEDAVNA